MADACCADDGCTDRDLDDDGPASFWAVGEVRMAAASGALLAGGLVAGALDATAAETVLFLVALAVGGSTFVPDTLRALARGKLGRPDWAWTPAAASPTASSASAPKPLRTLERR